MVYQLRTRKQITQCVCPIESPSTPETSTRRIRDVLFTIMHEGRHWRGDSVRKVRELFSRFVDAIVHLAPLFNVKSAALSDGREASIVKRHPHVQVVALQIALPEVQRKPLDNSSAVMVKYVTGSMMSYEKSHHVKRAKRSQ